MNAQAGDWLVVKSRSDSHHERRAAILTSEPPDGRPPYLVRWLDTGREALVFPGPDAHVVTAVAQAASDRIERDRLTAVQDEIISSRSKFLRAR
jgi:hypothetical protein